MERPRSTPGAQAGSATAEPETERAFLERYVAEIVAYAREKLVYPDEHPRLVARIGSMCRTLVDHLAERRRPLGLQVRAGTIWSGDHPVGEELPAAERLATRMRERMIQLIRVEPRVTEEEARALADLLVDEEEPVVDGPLEVVIGPSVLVFRMPPGFADGEEDGASEEEVMERARTAEAEVALPDADVAELPGLDDSQRRRALGALSAPGIRERLPRVLGGGPTVSGEREFLARYFSLLRDDPRTDWGSSRNLREAVASGLDFLEDALRRAGSGESLFPLLGHPAEETADLGTDLKWRLLRTFVPGDVLPPRPRPQADLRRLRERGGEPAPLTDDRESPAWASPDLVRLELELDEVARQSTHLVEMVVAAARVVTEEVEAERDVLRHLLGVLSSRVGSGLLDRAVTRRLLRATRPLPRGVAIRWQSALVRRLVGPEDVVEVLSASDEREAERGPDRADLLARPPSSVSVPIPDSGSDEQLSRSREILRQLLAPADVYALDVIYAAIAATGDDPDLVRPWQRILREVASMHGALDRWVERRALDLCGVGGSAVLECLPGRALQAGFSRHFAGASTRQQLQFVGAMERLGTAEAARLLAIALEFPSDWVRRVALGTLGAMRHRVAFDALVARLERSNEGATDEAEVRHVCALLAQRQGREGEQFLERILRERRGLRRRWRRPVRRLARAALARRLNPDGGRP